MSKSIQRMLRSCGACLLLLVATRADAGSITLAWDPNREPEVAGYVLRYGASPGDYPSRVDVGNLTAWTLNLPNGTYYFTVEAYTRDGVSSSRSNEVTATVGTPPPPPRQDLDGDGLADFLWQHSEEGWLAVWRIDNGRVLGGLPLSVNREPDVNWKVVGSGDFNADGKLDFLWRHLRDGRLRVWFMDGATVTGSAPLSHSVPDMAWRVAGVADLDGDGRPDILWHDQQAGWLAVWRMDGVTLLGGMPLNENRVADTAWQIAAVRDFSGDGRADILWHHRSEGWLAFWRLEGSLVAGGIPLSHNRVADTNWKVAGAADMNGDGQTDIIWRHADGTVAVWALRYGQLLGGVTLTPNRAEPVWQLVLPR